MTTTVEVTDRARLAAASSLEGFYREQVLALTQLCLNRQAEIATLNADHAKAIEEQEAGFLARIAGLEDELRVTRGALDDQEAGFSDRIAGLEDELRLARGEAPAAEVMTDGE